MDDRTAAAFALPVTALTPLLSANRPSACHVRKARPPLLAPVARTSHCDRPRIHHLVRRRADLVVVVLVFPSPRDALHPFQTPPGGTRRYSGAPPCGSFQALDLAAVPFFTPGAGRPSHWFAMADISKSKPGVGGKKGLEFDQGPSGGGGVAVITKPRIEKKTAQKSKTEREPSWRVLLHNDDVHTFDYVTGTIVKVVRTVSRKKAHRITMQAHSSGVATVTTTWKALAEDYCKGLQMHGLTSSIAPDSSFKA